MCAVVVSGIVVGCGDSVDSCCSISEYDSARGCVLQQVRHTVDFTSLRISVVRIVRCIYPAHALLYLALRPGRLKYAWIPGFEATLYRNFKNRRCLLNLGGKLHIQYLSERDMQHNNWSYSVPCYEEEWIHKKENSASKEV